MSAEKKLAFSSVVVDTLRKMHEVSVSASSSSYIVRRENGEIVVQRSDRSASAIPAEITRKSG